VDGATTGPARDAAIEGYKAGTVDALVISMGVGKYGHTLTNTRTIFYVDKTWAADDYYQSLHRVRRIGLKHSPVVVTIRAPGTVDDLIEDNLEGKLGGISRLTRSDLATLLAGLKGAP
jgi:SNF2 family DNA or RNA helicase